MERIKTAVLRLFPSQQIGPSDQAQPLLSSEARNYKALARSIDEKSYDNETSAYGKKIGVHDQSRSPAVTKSGSAKRSRSARKPITEPATSDAPNYNGRNYLDILPDDIIITILEQSSAIATARLACVDRRFNHLVRDHEAYISHSLARAQRAYLEARAAYLVGSRELSTAAALHRYVQTFDVSFRRDADVIMPTWLPDFCDFRMALADRKMRFDELDVLVTRLFRLHCAQRWRAWSLEMVEYNCRGRYATQSHEMEDVCSQAIRLVEQVERPTRSTRRVRDDDKAVAEEYRYILENDVFGAGQMGHSKRHVVSGNMAFSLYTSGAHKDFHEAINNNDLFNAPILPTVLKYHSSTLHKGVRKVVRVANGGPMKGPLRPLAIAAILEEVDICHPAPRRSDVTALQRTRRQ